MGIGNMAENKKVEERKEEIQKEEIEREEIRKVIVKISKGGRLTLPKCIREKYKIKSGDMAEWEEINNHSVKVTFYSLVKRLK